MLSLFTLTFQGKPEVVGDGLSQEQAVELARAAFPRSAPRDAVVREGFQAWKITPMSGGELLVAEISNRGDKDQHGRAALRATGCLLTPPAMSVGLRDPAAVWQALGRWEPGHGAEAFAARVADLSHHTSESAFAHFRQQLLQAGDFHGRVAAALRSRRANLYLDSSSQAPARLAPALGLLGLAHLQRLDLAIGGEEAEDREAILGVVEGSPPPAASSGHLLADLVDRLRGSTSVTVDFASSSVAGIRGDGAAALIEAIVDPVPWPGGLVGQNRYRVLVASLDAAVIEGRPATPFDLVPELSEMRRQIRQIERFAADLRSWR